MGYAPELCAKQRLGYKRFEGESLRLQIWSMALLHPGKENQQWLKKPG